MTDATAEDDRRKGGGGSGRWSWGSRVAVAACLAVVIGVAIWQAGDAERVLNVLAEREASLRELESDRPFAVYGAAFLVYVVMTGLSIPSATGMSLAYGWYFGFWQALLMVSFASTTGATIAFLMSRYLFREAVRRRFGDSLEKVDEALKQDGAYYLLALRLAVGVPFFILNLVAGLTPLRVRTYWWATQLGMLPATAIYVYAGSALPSLESLAEEGVGEILSWPVVLGLMLLALFPLLVRRLVRPGAGG